MYETDLKGVKPGDKVIIIDTSGHSFHLGDIVTVEQVSYDDIYARDEHNHGQYLDSQNYDPYIDTPEPQVENPDYQELHPSYDEILNGSFVIPRISASIAPKRSRTKRSAVSSPKVS